MIPFSNDVNRSAISAWRSFLLELAGGLEPKERWISILGPQELKVYCTWDYVTCCGLHPIRTPHAWTTLLTMRKGVFLKSFLCTCSCSFIELWRAKVRSELHIYVAACYNLYRKIKGLFTCTQTRRSRCLALRFIRCGVASMDSHSSM